MLDEWGLARFIGYLGGAVAFCFFTHRRESLNAPLGHGFRRRVVLGTVQGMLSGVKIIHPANAREIRSALGDVITACRRVQTQLQPVAASRDHTECLACVRPEARKPWWKKIRGER